MALFLSACLLDPDHSRPTRPWDGTPGYVRFEVSLDRNGQEVLGKVSASDTAFTLDSLILVLSATGAETQTYRIPVTGRPDTGAITLATQIYALNPLLTWKARFYTIDTTTTPERRDTVHIDSVNFAALPGDTTVVAKNIAPAFSVLHARFLSVHRDSLGAGIRFVRIKVGDVTMDSVALFGGIFNGVGFGDPSTGWIVQDSGRIFRSIDSGKTWFPQVSGRLANLRAVSFANATTGWVAGDSGVILTTTNAGVNWTSQTSGTSRRLNRLHFITTTTGYAAGDSGTVLKTTNGGATWVLKTGGWFPQSSGVSDDLKDAYFYSLTGGIAVGGNGVIRATTNAGSTWTAVTSPVTSTLFSLSFPTTADGWGVGDAGKVIQTTNSGAAWAEQTSNTENSLTGVYFNGTSLGWAVGTDETLLRTTNGGATWLNRSSGWFKVPNSINGALKAVHFAAANTGWAAGANAGIYRTTDNGVTWNAQTNDVSNTLTLNDVHFSGASAGWAVGDSDAITQTTDAGATWAAASKSGWYARSNSVPNNVRLNSVHFLDGATGVAVGAGGLIKKTINNGASWDASVTNTEPSNLNDVHFSGTSAGWAVGDSETVVRTADGGATWTSLPAAWTALTSGTSATLNATHFTSVTGGVVAGAGGLIKRTTNNGTSWDASVTNTETTNLNDVHFSGASAGYAVGDSETVVRTTDGGATWATVGNFPWFSQASGVPATHLNSTYFTSVTTGMAVGAGGLIRKTTNNGADWNASVSGAGSTTLNDLHFSGTSSGFAVGDSESVMRTTNTGVNWTTGPKGGWFSLGASGSPSLNAVHFTNVSTGWAVGAPGANDVRKTTNNGASWTGQTSNAPDTLYDVHSLSTTAVVAVGKGEGIVRTADGGSNWTNYPTGWATKTSGVATTIHSVRFANASTGWATTDNGTILKTADAGQSWTPQNNVGSNTKPLLGAFVIDANRVVAAGDSGIIKRTIDGGTNWTNVATAGAFKNIRGLNFAPGGAVGWAVGDTVRISLDSGKTWANQTGAGSNDFNAVFSNGNRVWMVGNAGVIYRRTDITNAALSSVSNNGVATGDLYGVHFTSNNVGYVVGANGFIARCSNSGNSNWTQQGAGVAGGVTLRHIFFKGDGTSDTGYVVGDGGVVLRTHDAGTTWTKVSDGTKTNALRSVYFASTNKDTVYAVGASGTILKSVVGGLTWSGRTPQTLHDVNFSSTSSGFAVGDSGTILRTNNGGASWAAMPSGIVTNLNGVYTNGTRAWAVGDGGVIRRLVTPLTATNTWASLTNGAINTEKLNAVHFTSDNVGYVVGDGGVIFKTTNSNNDNWTLQGSGVTADNLLHVNFKGNGTSDTGYAVGENGTILRTVNAGTNWVKLVSGTTERLMSVQGGAGGAVDTAYTVSTSGNVFKTANRGYQWSGLVSPQAWRGVHLYATTSAFAVGDSGTIVRTTNTGANWTPFPASGVSTRLNAVFVSSDASRVWVAGDNGILRYSSSLTTPSWAALTNSPPSGWRIHSLFFTSNTVGYAVGSDGRIYKTTDNGASAWVQQGSGVTTDTLFNVSFKGNGTNDTGYAVGKGGTILRTVNGGTNWVKLISGTSETLYGVQTGYGVANTDTAFAVGANGTVLKTTTRGTQLSGFVSAQALRGVHLYSATAGFAVGDSGATLRTTNSGVNWTPFPISGLNTRLNAVYSDATRAWAVGDNGVVRYTASVTTPSWGALTNSPPAGIRFLGVHYTSSTVGYVVGSDGAIYKTTDNGASAWVQQGSGVTTDTLYGISFKGNGTTDTGYAVGKNGTVLRTINGGTNWVKLQSGSTEKLLGVHTGFGVGNTDTTVAVGTGGTILKTSTRGLQLSGLVSQQALRGAHLYSATSGFVVGDSGVILRSTNSGLNWTPYSSGVTTRLNAVYSDGTRAWVVGDNGVIRYSSSVSSPSFGALTNSLPAGVRFHGVYFTSANVGYAVGADGAIYKTSNNGGAAWTQQGAGVTTDTLYSVSFRGNGTNDTGYAVGKNGTILRTVNAGTNWYKLGSGTTEHLTAVHAGVTGIGLDTAYAVGTNGTVLKTVTRGGAFSGHISKQVLRSAFLYNTTSGFVAGDSGLILRTTNSGANWTALTSGTTNRLNSVYSDGTRAWAVGVGGVVRHIAAIGTTSWSSLTTIPGVNLYGVHFTSATVGYAVGSSGAIYKTTNNGSSWTPQGVGITSDTLQSVYFRGDGVNDTGYAVGTTGTILRTTNGGASWGVKHLVNTTENLAGVSAGVGGTMDTAYAVGSHGTILKTYNAGALYSGQLARQFLLGVNFPTTSIGYVVGTTGTILKTTDGGVTWASQTNPVSNTATFLYAAHFTSATNGWAVGASGTILKTVDGAAWTAQTSGTTEHLYRVRFLNADTGWASGANGTILKTTNGGTQWTAQNSNVSVTLPGLFVNNADSAYAVGDAGTIIKTRNGGVANIGLENVNGIYARNDSIYIVGSAAKAYRSRDGGASWTLLTGATENLNGVFSTGNNTYIAGDNGQIATIPHSLSGTAVTLRTSNTTRNLHSIWGSPTGASSRMYAVGDNGTLQLLTGSPANAWTSLGGNVSEAFYGVNCSGAAHDCWTVGGNETVLRTTNGLDWFTQTSGSKIFDVRLGTKYFKPGLTDTVTIQAIDRLSPLRGYQKQMVVLVGAGQDSTLNTGMTRCGYGGATPECKP